MFNININFCQWLDSNHGPLVLEATALPTEPQPLPNLIENGFCSLRHRKTTLSPWIEQGGSMLLFRLRSYFIIQTNGYTMELFKRRIWEPQWTKKPVKVISELPLLFCNFINTTCTDMILHLLLRVPWLHKKADGLLITYRKRILSKTLLAWIPNRSEKILFLKMNWVLKDQILY